jgi:hypothetical protein
MEFWIIGKMLRQNLDVYIPLVDDRGVDAIIRRDTGTFAEVQIKARSAEVVMKDAALFAGITHDRPINSPVKKVLSLSSSRPSHFSRSG